MYNGQNRKKQRLKGYDYSLNGGYFLTFCTKNRENYFGEIKDGKMILNDCGKIVEKEIYKTCKIRQNIIMDEFIIMPDHVHLIVFIVGDDCLSIKNDYLTVGNDCVVPNNQIIPDINKGPMQLDPTKQLVPMIMKGLKSSITKQINEMQNEFDFKWQKSYYDRIIRNENELNIIRQYIINNPIKWKLDSDPSNYFKIN